MSKFIIGLLLGLSITSALPDEQGKFSIDHQIRKVLAHLDADELAAIKEACK